jgi:hypothetical protein
MFLKADKSILYSLRAATCSLMHKNVARPKIMHMIKTTHFRTNLLRFIDIITD